VGIVADKRHTGLRETPQADLFLPIAQMTEPWLRSWFVVRGRVNAVGLLPAIQNAVASVDPAVAIGSFAIMETRMANSVAPDRFRAWLVGVLAALALTLAVLGIYGLLAWTVARETRDIGIRAALGQSPPLAVALSLSQRPACCQDF